MPAYPLADPRHPNNRAHVFYLALQEAGLVGKTIPSGKWRSMVKLATGVLTDKATRDYTQHMIDLLMVRRRGNNIYVREDGLKLLLA